MLFPINFIPKLCKSVALRRGVGSKLLPQYRRMWDVMSGHICTVPGVLAINSVRLQKLVVVYLRRSCGHSKTFSITFYIDGMANDALSKIQL